MLLPLQVGFSKSAIFFCMRFDSFIRKYHAPASPHSGGYMVARYEREGTCSLSLMPGYWIYPRCTTHAVGVQLGLGEQPFS